MQYPFKLHWEELSEELQEQKVTEYIDVLKQQGQHMTREGAEESIRAYFPMYF